MSAWIFAYGSNMCLGRFLDYNVHAEAPGERARLEGYVLRFNKRSTDESGKANVEPCDGGVVWGVLYSIPDAELPILSRGEGGYTPIQRSVVRDAGPVDAWVYVATQASANAALRPYSW
jgi:cation transport regulator ChaC